MTDRERLMKFAGREVRSLLFFGIFSLAVLIISRILNRFKGLGIVLALASFSMCLFSYGNLKEKRNIIGNMKRLERIAYYKSYSKLYFILEGVVFPQVIHKIDGRYKDLGLDEIGVFAYISDKKKDEFGKEQITYIDLDRKHLNASLKAFKFEEVADDRNLELEFRLEEAKSRYRLTYNSSRDEFNLNIF